MKNENTMDKANRDAAKVVLSEVYNDKSFLRKQDKISNIQPNLTPQTAREKNKQNAKIAEGKKS